MDKETKAQLDELGKAWEQFKTNNDQALKDAVAGLGVAEITEKVEKINDAMTDITKQRDEAVREAKILAERVDELEATIDAIDVSGKPDLRKDLKEHADLVDAWMRSFHEYEKTGDPELRQKILKMQKEIPEYKEFSTTVGATGGVAVPEVIARQINDQVRLISPIRGLVKTVTVGSPDYKELLNIHGESSGWVGETGTRNLTDTPQFIERAPTSGTLYAYPRATEESLQDVFFNIPQMIVQVTSDEFAIQEEDAVLRGDGTNKHTGMLNTTPTTEADDASPVRDASAYEYIPLDTASPTTAIDPDQLLTMIYKLRRPYRMRARWAMNSPTTGTIRKLKDGQSQYLWAPGLQAGQPDRLLGFPVETLEGMDDVTQDLFPIAFGDWQRAYVMILIAGLRITVDDNITLPGYVKWYIRQRVGGIVLDSNALKFGRYDT